MYRLLAITAIHLFAALVQPSVGLQAQSNESTPARPTILAEDSAELVQAARSDQASFERLRRNRLPATWSGGSSRCDERIGRFCLTHGTGYDDWIAPPEDEQIVASRANLIDGLSQVAQLIPGDGWIAGQRVRYLVEARRLDEALTAARQCEAEPWWCHALSGFVHHYSARAEEADREFGRALASMEEEERIRWEELSMILDERSLRVYRRMAPEDRPPFEARFWRLSDPLLTRPGNELRSEHLARHVWDQFQFRAQSADGISWGYDLREILVRYGWPSGWERTRDWATTAGPPPLVSHYSSAPHYLLPPPETLLQESGTEGTWEADVPRSRTGYNIPLADSVARWFSPLAHQVAVFRRGESATIVAGYELPADSVPADALVHAGLALLPTTDVQSEPTMVVDGSASRTGALQLTAPARPVLMSLEIVVPGERRLARARYGLDLAPVTPGLISLSDLLLLEGGETLPDSLPQAMSTVRGSNRVHRGEPIAVYWEIYGLDPQQTPELSLSIRLLQGRTGWLRRLAERAGLLREVMPIRLRWQEPTRPGPYMARSLGIEVPDVPDGTYTLELIVEAPGREALSVRKDIEVRSD